MVKVIRLNIQFLKTHMIKEEILYILEDGKRILKQNQ